MPVAGATGAAIVMLAVPALAASPALPPAGTALSNDAVSRRATAPALPLGRSGLPETRKAHRVAPGVTWTVIRRGSGTAKSSEIATTQAGPWRVNVLTINPKTARGRLVATVGPNLATPETTSWLTRFRGGLAAVNGGFFAINGPQGARGEPVGLSIIAGSIASEPQLGSAAVGLLLDSKTNRVRVGSYTWKASLTNLATNRRVWLKAVNRPPVVPSRCADQPDQAGCTAPGELIRFTGWFGARTPSGPGYEVVVNSKGCPTRLRSPRGGPLPASHTSYQATGAAAASLRQAARRGCLALDQRLYDDAGRRVSVTPSTYAVNGRAILVRNGTVVNTGAGGSLAGRHPRTIAGRTAGGSIVLVTIDGRRGTSVGATLTETAAVAASLGLHDAVNLDGGGSTTMVVNGKVVNTVSGRRERAVGDALVWMRS